jgi:ribosomal-protein-alanine N-acetyltransferase
LRAIGKPFGASARASGRWSSNPGRTASGRDPSERAMIASMRFLVAGLLVLEPQVVGHAEAMFEVLRDPELYAFEGEPPASPDAVRERFRRLESRRSPDATELWLNWVLRPAPRDAPVGYVQATVRGDGRAAIAYVLAPSHWGRGLASRAVETMLAELAAEHGVRRATAVLKVANLRSLRLLQRLQFTPASAALSDLLALDDDEIAMERALAPPTP